MGWQQVKGLGHQSPGVLATASWEIQYDRENDIYENTILKGDCVTAEYMRKLPVSRTLRWMDVLEKQWMVNHGAFVSMNTWATPESERKGSMPGSLLHLCPKQLSVSHLK